MNNASLWFTRLYAQLLALYPRRFQADFAEEMKAVFALRIKEAARAGIGQPLCLTLREMGALPLALWAAYTRERRPLIMQKRLVRWFIHEPGSWQEILLASLPFLALCLVLGTFSFKAMEAGLSPLVGLGLMGLIILALALLGIAGMLVRLPRWSMPYAGVLIAGAVFLALNLLGLQDLFFGGMQGPWWLRMAAFELLYLVVLFAATLLSLRLARKIALTSIFFEQVRKDWSLISFAMYGGAFTLVIGMYEEIANGGLYILLTILPFLFSTWVYLRQPSLRRRLTALSLGITVAMGIALVAHLLRMDLFSPAVFQVGGMVVTRSILSIFLSWLLGLGMLFVPMLLPRISFDKQAQVQTA